NPGRAPHAARDVATAKGITINGLVILTEPPSHTYSSHTNPPGGLANYYRNNVIGGAGAFVAVAKNFNSFGNAITKKLIAEIAQAEPTAVPPTLLARADEVIEEWSLCCNALGRDWHHKRSCPLPPSRVVDVA